MMTPQDVVRLFVHYVARVADNPATTECEMDTLLCAIDALDDIVAGRGSQPRW